MSDDLYHKIIQLFLDPNNSKFTGSDTRKFAFGKEQCKSDNGKDRQCSLAKGHDGDHEHWQWFEWATDDMILNGGEYRGESHEPWECGMRIRVWA